MASRLETLNFKIPGRPDHTAVILRCSPRDAKASRAWRASKDGSGRKWRSFETPRKSAAPLATTAQPLRGDDGECEASKEAKTNEQAIRVSPNRLLVEDLSAIGYPRPAPSLTASDHVFFEGRTARTEKRSTAGSSRFTFLPVCAMKRKGRHARA
jgi:hypothetical protein